MSQRSERVTIKKWLAEHARDEAVHYRDIADALGRDPASVSASLSIERKQAQEGDRPPYFVRVAPGLYRYNDLCEGAVDEEAISEVRLRAEEFNKATRSKMNQVIADLDLEGFKRLAEVILVNIRARVEEIEVERRHNGSVVMITSWRDDGGRSPVVVYAKKCDIDEEVDVDTILEIRGALPRLKANQGVLITNGVVNEEGRKEALGYAPNGMKVSVPPIHIMDKEIILNVLLESRTGIRPKNVEVFLLDMEFFERLNRK